MGKSKSPQHFWFKDQTNKQVADGLNRNHPITIAHNKDLLDRVHARYPLLERKQVAYIIKNVFTSFRELLIMGKILHVLEIGRDWRMTFTLLHRKAGVILSKVKIKITTPLTMRYPDGHKRRRKFVGKNR